MDHGRTKEEKAENGEKLVNYAERSSDLAIKTQTTKKYQVKQIYADDEITLRMQARLPMVEVENKLPGR